MASMFVPQMVTPVDTSFLRDIGNTIGGLKQDSEIADILKGIDPYDPNSKERVINDLRQHSPAGRDMADRMEGLDIRRQTANQQGEYQRGTLGYHQGTLDLAREKYRGEQTEAEAERARKVARQEQLRKDLAEDPEAVPTGAPTVAPTATPASPAPTRQQPPAPGGIFAQPSARPPVTAPPTAATEDAAAAAGPVPYGRPAAPVPGTNAQAAAGMLGQRPLPPPSGPQVAGGAVPVPAPPPATVEPPPVAAVPSGPPPAPAPAGAPVAVAPAAAPTATAPVPGGKGPIGHDDLVQNRAIPPRPPTPTPEMLKIERDLRKLAVAKVGADADEEKAIAARMHDKREKLKTLASEQNEAYKADIVEFKDTGSKHTAAAVKKYTDISAQFTKDQSAKVGLTRAQAILDQNIPTGQAANAIKWTARTADVAGQFLEYLPFGIDANKIESIKRARDTAGAMEELHGVSAKALHDILGGFGAGIAVPEGDRLARMIADNDKTVLGNRNLIKFADDLVTTRMEAAREIGAYMRTMAKVPGGPREADMDEIQARHVDRALKRMEIETEASRGGRIEKEKAAATAEDAIVARNEARKAAAIEAIKGTGRKARDFLGLPKGGPPPTTSVDETGGFGQPVGSETREVGPSGPTAIQRGQAGARELLRGDNPATRFFQGEGRPTYGAEGVGGLGGIPPRGVGPEPQRGGDMSSLPLQPSDPSTQLPLIRHTARLAPNGIPWDAMRRSQNIEVDSEGYTGRYASEGLQDRMAGDTLLNMPPRGQLSNEAGLADLEAEAIRRGVPRTNITGLIERGDRERALRDLIYAPLPKNNSTAKSKTTEEAERRRRNRATQ